MFSLLAIAVESGATETRRAPPELVIIVFPAPAPTRVIPLVKLTGVLQEQAPEGTATVSFRFAASSAPATADCEHEAAFMVAPYAGIRKPRTPIAPRKIASV